MYYDQKHLQIAAKMVGDGDPSLLCYKLGDVLDGINDMCQRAGGKLKSRQVIASIIHQWIINNPEIRPYGE